MGIHKVVVSTSSSRAVRLRLSKCLALLERGVPRYAVSPMSSWYSYYQQPIDYRLMTWCGVDRSLSSTKSSNTVMYALAHEKSTIEQ